MGGPLAHDRSSCTTPESTCGVGHFSTGSGQLYSLNPWRAHTILEDLFGVSWPPIGATNCVFDTPDPRSYHVPSVALMSR